MMEMKILLRYKEKIFFIVAEFFKENLASFIPQSN